MKKLSIIALAFLFSCTANSGKEQTPVHEEEKTTQATTSTIIEVQKPTISLDNGNKWKANAETTEGITHLKKIVAKAIESGSADSTLAEPLQKEFQYIFDKCTMKGDSHDQLHNFLIPIKSYLEQIKSGSASSATMVAFQNHLNTYENYFE